MKLSIIIPLYNAEKYFRECIDSLYQQDLAEADFEVIVINDGSTDGSLALARQLAAEHTNMTVVDKENEGQGVARNLGMSMAKGEYIMFVDSDDYLAPHASQGLLRLCQVNNLDMLMTSLRVWQKNQQYHPYYTIGKNRIFSGEELILTGFALGTTCGIVYRRVFLTTVGLQFRTDLMHEDVDFIYKLVPSAKRILVSDTVLYNYRYNPMSTDRYVDSKKQRRSILSDITIAHDLQSFADATRLSLPLRHHFYRMTNSQLADLYIQIFKGKVDKLTRHDALRLINSYQLFPLRGGGYTWKSTALIYVANLLYWFQK